MVSFCPTKCLLFRPYLCSGFAGMLSYSDPPSSPLWMDRSSNIGSLPVVGLSLEPLPGFETYVFAKGISSVVAMN
jgi:hypothetical protein